MTPPALIRRARKMLGRLKWRFQQRFLELPCNYLYDATRYRAYADYSGIACNARLGQVQLAARLVRCQHVLEKAMALRHTRIGFGQVALEQILGLLNEWVAREYPVGALPYQQALWAIQQYLEFHIGAGQSVDVLSARFARHLESRVPPPMGGTKTCTREAVLEGSRGDFDSLTSTRYSVRDFTAEPVDLELIRQAVRIAQRTPSVCNRQTSRVYILSDKNAVCAALSVQNGNRGFAEYIEKVLIVTSELREFTGAGERNQPFVDGGMFSMTLIYALHSLGLGTCSLNWSAAFRQDKALRALVRIRQSECIIMMIAVGHLPAEFAVALSARKPIEDIVTLI